MEDIPEHDAGGEQFEYEQSEDGELEDGEPEGEDIVGLALPFESSPSRGSELVLTPLYS